MRQINSSISLLRIFSMLLIVITHFLSWKNINDYQISTIGVSCFLFISGYLYGTKRIENNFKWMIQRIERVLVPFWILSFVLSVYLITSGDYLFAFRQFLESLLNLQGLHSIIHISLGLGNGHVSGLAHCWFLTIIMLCYLGVIFIKNSKIECYGDNSPKILLLIAVLAHLVFSFVNISIGYFVVFFVGYFYKRIETSEKRSVKFILISTLVMLFVVFARIFLKQKIDGGEFYNFFISSFSSNVCAIWCFVFVNYICQKKEWISSITATKGWSFLDDLTYPLYLTHFMFLQEPFNLSKVHPLAGSTLKELVSFIMLSLASAFILNIISIRIKKLTLRLRES